MKKPLRTFAVSGTEPHEPSETFTIYVAARNEDHAKKYARWLHCLYRNGKPIKLTAFPSNEEAQDFADRF